MAVDVKDFAVGMELPPVSKYMTQDKFNAYEACGKRSYRGIHEDEEVAKKEGLAVTDEEVDERIRRMAEVNNQKLDSLKRILQRNNQIDRIRRDILYEKTLKLLIEGAQIEEVEENPEEEGRILTP